jgi:hypothetical protein
MTEHSDSAQFKGIVSGFGELSPEARLDSTTMDLKDTAHNEVHDTLDNAHKVAESGIKILNNPQSPKHTTDYVANALRSVVNTVHDKLGSSNFISDHHPTWGFNCSYPGCKNPQFRWPWADDRAF